MVKSPSTISGPPTLVKQDVKVFSPKALRERECALAVAADRTKVSHSSFAVSEKQTIFSRGLVFCTGSMATIFVPGKSLNLAK